MPMTRATWMRGGGGAQRQTAHNSGSDDSTFHADFLSSVDRVFRSQAIVKNGITSPGVTDIDGTKPCVSVCHPRVTVCNDQSLGLPFRACR